MIIAITQARTTSTRLPNKVLKTINGKTLLQIHIERIQQSKHVNQLIVATTVNDTDAPIVDLCHQLGCAVTRGSESDVLDRFYQSVKNTPPQYIVRLTSDCPLIDAQLIDKVIDSCIQNDLDYCSNTLDPHYPDGQDVEVFKFSALEKAWKEAQQQSEREHVTPYIWKNSTFKGGKLFQSASFTEGGVNYGHLRMTVDEQIDFEVIEALIAALGTNKAWLDYTQLLAHNPTIQNINKNIKRNEGYQKSIKKEVFSMKKTETHRYAKSEAMLERALKTVPLGSQTFSKSKTQYPMGVSPYFIAKAKGANVWDVDGNKYIDFINSLCAITLGYNDAEVMKAVANQLKIGTIFSLPHELEILVSEQICAMIPCAEMVRFGKNGADATGGAIRIARAYTGRDHVLTCGYHGWHDWYIGSTTRDKGVPESTKALTHKFNYNDLDSLEQKLNGLQGQVAAVILEPVNVFAPEPGFLEGVRDLAHKHGALLVFDETITGFRYANGGAQEFFGVIPDLATFGKGVANGYPLAVLAGKAKYMKVVEDIFFSFTFGGELLSLAASHAVLAKLKREPVIEHLNKIGTLIIEQLNALIAEKQLQDVFSVSGYPVWSFLMVKDTPQYSAVQLKTLMMQEMFENGILMYGTHNISYAHTEAHVKALMKSYAKYFDKVKLAQTSGSLDGILKCTPLEPLFKVR